MDECKPSIGTIKAIFLIAFAVIFDAIKVILFFLNALPGIGTAIDFVVSMISSALEDGIEFLIFQFSGAYKNNTASLVLMAATFGAGFVPLIDDLPLTTVTVLTTLWLSNKSDKLRCEQAKAQYAAEMEAQNRQVEILEQAKEEAAARAQAQRAEAMQESLRRAA